MQILGNTQDGEESQQIELAYSLCILQVEAKTG